MIPRINFPRPRKFGALMTVVLIGLFIRTTRAGTPSEERLLMRLRDEQNRLSDDPLLADDPSGDRSRRQLPTEINIQVTAPLFTARLYDYGLADGDKEVPPSIDVGIKYDLKQPLTFFDQKLTEIYILSNGGIGFEANSRNYKADVFHGGPMLIAPLWNRNDLRKGGKIFYREVTEGRAIERAQSEVRYQFDKIIKPTSVLLVTWVHMQPMGEQNLSEDNSNTFQAAIVSSDNGTFANFIFKSIGWTQGAEAGFSKGDSKNFYGLPTSGTSNIMYLKDYGNTGIPGEWMFEIGQSKIIRCQPGVKGDTCDDKCADYEWGNDCEKCCHCGKGRCSLTTGECPGECKQCWKNAPHCDKREGECRVKAKECGYNAISFTDYDRCGEAVVRCQCLSGYTGDGFNCTDVDECSKPNTCSPAANCYNTPGRFYCECQSGFTGNGTICTPSAGGGSGAGAGNNKGGNSGGSGGGGLSIITSINRTSTSSGSGVGTSSSNSAPFSSAPLSTTDISTTLSQSTSASTSSSQSSSATSTTTLRATSPEPGLGLQLITLSTTTLASTLATETSTSSTLSSSSSTSSSATLPSLSKATGLEFEFLPGLITAASTGPITAITLVQQTQQAVETKKSLPKTQYPDAVQSLPKETYSQITYRMKQPLNIFGKRRDRLIISSTGLIALDDVPPVTPDDDLDQLGVSGFAPFFGKIDLGQRGVGTVTVRETSHSFVLTEATSLVDNYFHAPNFMAKSVLTISFDNVTTSTREHKNNFQMVLIGGNNALGENVTYVEYVYSNLQWTEGAQAIILADNSANSVQLPGSGSEGVRQLSQLSNIDEPGQWMYRVDLERITCPQSNLLPPYCNSDTPAPTTSAYQTSHAGVTSLTGNNSIGSTNNRTTGPSIDFGLHTVGNNSVPQSETKPTIGFTDFEDETVTFPAFVTVLPQLLTQSTPVHADAAFSSRAIANATSPLSTPLSVTLRIADTTVAAIGPATVDNLSPVTAGPPQPPAITGDNLSPPQFPQPPSNTVPAAPSNTVPQPPSITAVVPPLPVFTTSSTENVPIVVNGSAPTVLPGPLGPLAPSIVVGSPVPPTVGPAGPPILPRGTDIPLPPLPALPLNITAPPVPFLVTNATAPALAAALPPQLSLPPVFTPLNVTPGWQQSTPNESHILVAPAVEFGVANNNNLPTVANVADHEHNHDDSTANLPPLQIFTTPKKLPRPPVPTRPPPRIVTATQGPGGPNDIGGPPRRLPPNVKGNKNNDNNNDNNLQNIAGENEELDSLNSPSKLAIIIPTAIVGVWLLLLMLIGIVVCCKRRSSRRRMRSKYDPGYQFRHMPSIAAAPRNKEAAAVAAAAAAASSGSQANGVYPQPHVTYEDHLEKAARLSEMSQYGQNGGRVSMYGSYWNMPNNNRQYSYYNQGYYESCPEFNRTNYYNGRY